MNDTDITLLIICSGIVGFVLMYFIMQYGKRWEERRKARKKGK